MSHHLTSPEGRAVAVSEMLVIDEAVATWVSEVVTQSLDACLKHASAIEAAAGLPPHVAFGPGAASASLRLAVANLMASLGSWMDDKL